MTPSAIRIAGVAALALSLVACSSSSTSEANNGEGSTTPSSASAAASTTAETLPEPEATTTTAAPVPVVPLTIDQLLAIGRPIVLAHAGGEDQHPHSTPYAYAESAAAGVDMLDFDVQLTGDGVLVVHHDDDVSRTTNGVGKVAEMTYDELALLDNAYWFTADCTCRDQPDSAYILRGMRTGDRPPLTGYEPDDFVIPRFRDIVERFPSMPLNIEIKSGDTAIAAAQELARLLTELDRLDNAVVASFDDAVVTAFQEFAPIVEVSPGLAASTAFVLGGTPLPAGMRILQLPPEFQGIQVLTADTIAASKAAGYVIWVWPNDRKWENPSGYATLLAMGLEGLNINFPAAGVAAVQTFLS